MRAVAVGLRVLLAVVFAGGAAAKLTHLDEFAAAVAGYQLLPASAVSIVAALVIALETALALALFAGRRVRAAALASATLLTVLASVAAVAWMRGARFDCGCFPGVLRESVGMPLFIRNGTLLAASLALFKVSRPQETRS